MLFLVVSLSLWDLVSLVRLSVSLYGASKLFQGVLCRFNWLVIFNRTIGQFAMWYFTG